MLTISWIWLLIGVILCVVEAFFPTTFVALIMGLSAIAVALLSLGLKNLTLQVILWFLFSLGGVILARKFLRTKPNNLRVDAEEGETLTAIAPGEAGRVLYEGNSWRALCADEHLAIASQAKVYVVGRKGNTLIILPTKF
jgi:membrane protein implicated in regulation of membrane protease activity